MAEARSELRRDLANIGLEAEDDGLSFDRINLALESYHGIVTGFARWSRQQKALEGFPAQRLVRLSLRNEETDWPTRWNAALARTTMDGATDAGEMVALVNHPMWIEMSWIRRPYPPFTPGSSFGIEPVDRDDAEELGLLSTTAAELMLQPIEFQSTDGEMEARRVLRSLILD